MIDDALQECAVNLVRERWTPFCLHSTARFQPATTEISCPERATSAGLAMCHRTLHHGLTERFVTGNLKSLTFVNQQRVNQESSNRSAANMKHGNGSDLAR
ncbi:MAG: hypothetical protein OXH76_07775 [Boseongicola sp.]|nr:hypothetical protein [Boseongicola sp.]